MTRAALALALILGCAGPAAAQGFLQWGQSPRAMGMAGAGAGLADDPSAAWLNPAGIVQLPGSQLQIGGAMTARSGSFQGYGTPDADARTSVAGLPVVHATHAVAEGLAAGFSVTTPWRADVEWDGPAAFAGRFRATESHVRGLAVNPVVAYRVTPEWAVAAGVTVVDARLALHRFEQDPALSALGGGGPIELAFGEYDLSGNGVGWNAGAFWSPRPDLSAGAQVRGGISVPLSGPTDFTVVAPAALREVVAPDGGTIGELLDRRYRDQVTRSRLTLPAIATAGGAWSPIEPVILALDVQWVGWSTLRSLPLAPADTTLGERVALGYDDAWALRIGAEAHPTEAWRVRVGFAREWSPAPGAAVGPLLPDADRSVVSFGLGLRWLGTDFDAGYRLAVLAEREGVAFPGDADPDGRFDSTEHRLAVGATRRF